jgi:predicted ATPase
MITLVDATNYRCLRQIRQHLGPFHVLVGPNASGKTTFLDVIAFLGRLVSEGPEAAIDERTHNFYDLVWRQGGSTFVLAIEARIPDELRARLAEKEFDTVRYEVLIAIDPKTQERRFRHEEVLLTTPMPVAHPLPLDSRERRRVVIRKAVEDKGVDEFLSEDQSDVFVFKLGPRRSALGNLPPDESKFPIGLWLQHLLTSGVQQFVLNSLLIRKASPPGLGPGFRPDGSNLPWVVAELKQRSPDRFRQWIAHLRTAFPDLEDIETIERPEDRHRYLVLQYGDDLKVPSWMVSDGTLRMLALTLPAYLEDFKGIYLIEEPENGIHPRAIETMTQSLSSVYNAQVLLATHSPVILSTVEPEQVLCFSKTPEGATAIVRGSEHPALQSWKHETTLGTLFAAGVLG